MRLYQLQTPQRWLAGTIGGQPIYHDCADCGSKEPEIHGFIGSGPRFEQMGIFQTGAFFKLAVFCKDCWQKRKEHA